MPDLKRHVMHRMDLGGGSLVFYDPVSGSAMRDADLGAARAGSAVEYYFMQPDPRPRFNWEVTSACTWRCAFCFQSVRAAGAGEGLEVSPDLVERAIGILRLADAGEVSITGGEPLLVRNLAEVLGDLRRRLPRIRIRVLASGRRVTARPWFDDTLAALRRVGATVRIPLYGSLAEDHDAITGVDGSHADVIDLARRLRAAAVPLVMGVGVFEHTADGVFDTIAAGVHVGAGEVAVSTLVYPPKRPNGAASAVRPRPIGARQCVRLLADPSTAALATQYVSLEDTCSSGCLYPTIDAEGVLHDCDITLRPSAEQDAWRAPLPAAPEGCAGCPVFDVCRRCHALAGADGCASRHRDCVTAAAYVVGRRVAAALAQGFGFVDGEAARRLEPFIPGRVEETDHHARC